MNRGAHLLFDNLAVVQMLQRLLDSTFVVPRYGFGNWLEIQELLETHRCLSFTCEWVPAHGRLTEWEATGPVDTATCRMLNDKADEVASSMAKEFLEQRAGAYMRAVTIAASWSYRALSRLVRAASAFLKSSPTFSTHADKWLTQHSAVIQQAGTQHVSLS